MPSRRWGCSHRTCCTCTERAFGVIDKPAWDNLVHQADVIAVWCLTIAMAAVGLGTGLAKLRGLGWKPFSVGFAAALLVGGVGALLIKTIVPLIAAHSSL